MSGGYFVLIFRVVVGIIASKRCDNLKIYGNEVYDGGENAAGIFLHRSSDDSEVYSESISPVFGGFNQQG